MLARSKIYPFNASKYYPYSRYNESGNRYPWAPSSRGSSIVSQNKPYVSLSGSSFGRRRKKKGKRVYWAIRKNRVVKVLKKKKKTGSGYKYVYTNGDTFRGRKYSKKSKAKKVLEKRKKRKKRKKSKKRKSKVYVYVPRRRTYVVRRRPRATSSIRARGRKLEPKLRSRGLPCYKYTQATCGTHSGRCKWADGKCQGKYLNAFGSPSNRFNYQLMQQANNVATPSVGQMSRLSRTGAYDYPLRQGMSNYAYYKNPRNLGGYGF